MGSVPPPPGRAPLSSVLPPLILGTATFNTQYVTSPQHMPYLPIVSRALTLGITAFDTSPYYGPSELLLGDALRSISPRPARNSYTLITKVGRVASAEFDYSPAWIRYSVCRSLERLDTEYLDLVYAHDVEFVSPDEVVGAVKELRRLRDQGLIRYVGISGYPVPVLCDLAEKILRETGEPVDAVLSYSHFCVQNSTLGEADILSRFENARVGVLLNASMLSMGLLTTRGVDDGPQATWHPAPGPLRRVCNGLAAVAAEADETLEDVALHWALANWARAGATMGAHFAFPSREPVKVGASVLGVTRIEELDETWQAWQDAIADIAPPTETSLTGSPSTAAQRREKLCRLVEERMWPALGSWRNYSWTSPPEGFVNQREQFGQLPKEGMTLKWADVIAHGTVKSTA